MELNKALDSIQSKIGLQGSRMTEEEENVLKSNLDDTEVVCFYAMGLLMNSSVRFKKLFFRGYDELQNQAFELLNGAIEEKSGLAMYLMAQVKCGLFGKFPRDAQAGKALFERYYELTKDEHTKTEILDNWENYNEEMRCHFEDMKIYEVMNDLRDQGFSDFSSHDEAYYDE